MHFLLIPVLLYFLPTIVASVRRSHHGMLIFLLNLFAGWTVIGWIAAMIWAVLSSPRCVYVYPASQGYRRY